MALVSASGLSIAFNGLPVLEDVDLEIHPDSRFGIVGANGSGKTTLMRILLGELEPDDGTVEVRRGIRIEWLKQETVLDRSLTPHEIVLEGFADVLAVEGRLRAVEEQMAGPRDEAHLATLMDRHSRLQTELEALGGYEVGRRAEEALSGLGVGTEDHGRPLGVLSGGQQTRVALARVLVRQPDLLVLDEPTNHLDVEATVWLENRLAAWPGAFVVISHDRYFLDEVAGTIGELQGARLTLYPGNYTAYREQREVRVKTIERAHEKQQREIAHAEDFIARNLAAQRVSMARGRQKMLTRMKRVGPAPRDEARLNLDLGEGKGGQGDVLTLDGVGHAFEEGRWLFRRFSFRFERGERVGILGPNGGGKTTLLRISADILEPREGTRREGKAVRIGVFEQERLDLDPGLTPLEIMREIDPRATDGALRSWLGRFRVSGDDALRPVRTLSGGESARVALARLLYAGPNVLFLDEPTNHLDIPAREALEEALEDFPGSVLLVSHDRRFLDRTVGRILLVADGAIRAFHGGYTAYQEQIARERSEARAAAEEAERRRRAERVKKSLAKAKSPGKPRLEQVEAAIIEREERVEAILEEMGRESVYKNADLMRDLTREKETIAAELEGLEEQWGDLAG